MADRRPPRREGRPAAPGPRGKHAPRPRPGGEPRPHRREADGSHAPTGPRPPRPRPGDARRPGAPNSEGGRPRRQGGKSLERRPARPSPENEPGAERLQKLLAHSGVGSRRACEDFILQGRVSINGLTVRELGTKVVPGRDKVAVDGQPIHDERPAYIAVNKPKGYVSTNKDPSGRPRVVDLVPDIPQRVYTVGRLDEMSTGLMLLTNDGDLANRLSHPKFGVEKVYRAVVAGTPPPEVLQKLVEGVWLAEGKVRAKRVKPIAHKGDATVMELVLAEGKNREVRRMFAKFGHKVMTLTRVAVGPVTLKGLKPGGWRFLNAREVDLLRKVADGIPVPTGRFGDDRPARRPTRGPQSYARPGDPPRRGPGPERRPAGPARGENRRPPRREDGPPRPRLARLEGDGPPPRFAVPGGSRRPMPPRPAGQDGGRPRPPRPLTPGGDSRPGLSDAGAHSRPPRPGGQGGPPRPPRPHGEGRDSRPPQRDGPGGNSRPPRPNGEGRDSRPPQRDGPGGNSRPPRPSGPGGPQRSHRPVLGPPREEIPTRRIIGLETGRGEGGPEARRPQPRRRPGPGPSRFKQAPRPMPPRRRKPGGEDGE